MVSLVTTLEEAMTFVVAGSDILQLDGFTPEAVPPNPAGFAQQPLALPPWPCPAE